jgi:prophage regulatory protein
VSERLISMKEISARVPFTKVHIYRLMNRGEFPRSIKIGKRRVCWRESDIDAWISSKVAKSSDTEAGQ